MAQNVICIRELLLILIRTPTKRTDNMKDPVLELQMQEVSHLISELKAFRDILVSTLNTEVVVPDYEAKLTKLKETIPESARKLYSDLYEDYDSTTADMVSNVSDLSLLIKFTDLEKRKLLEAWHKYYLKMHFMLGKLKSRKEKLESLSLSSLKAKNLFFSPYFMILVLGIIIFLVFIYLSTR
jgi:hypothetical protein